MKSVVRVANAGGYWGDDPQALRRQLEGGPLDYVTMDFLAEITMVILQRQRAADPEAGFARDFVFQLRDCVPLLRERPVTLVVNAGGIHPAGCARAVERVLAEAGLDWPIGVVYGDDILGSLPEWHARGYDLSNLDDGRPFSEIAGKVAAANAYLGAKPVVEALRLGARVVVTGRTTDAALVLAPLVHEFGWAWDEWDKLAAGTIAGHILECGAQATGGNLTDWQEIPSMLDMGYPIAEVSPDGEFVVTKHPGTGGVVNRKSVTEQLLYEIADPRAYATPDVTADFTSVEVREEGPDRVRVRSARGGPPPRELKASIVYEAGYKAVGSCLLSGPDVLAKARRFEEMLWHRVGREFEDLRADAIGYDACWGPAAPKVEPNEIVFRAGVRDSDRKKVQAFALQFLGFGLQLPPGFGVLEGRPSVQTAYGFWPARFPREGVEPVVEIRQGGSVRKRVECPLQDVPRAEWGELPVPEPPPRRSFSGPVRRVRLREIAFARSGDKGDRANIGVVARSAALYDFLRSFLSAERVALHFGELVRGGVERFELPNLLALNFVLDRALGGGGTLSLRVDHQGKTLAQGLLSMEVEVPEELLQERGGA
ncbi:MAG: hypothetical protein KatS3mg076_0600 [Candidatus Binatia bacterium]|nr:MAG: hypothetical protein KatS3mg076_0600 [Candidatus Binatia bacterium]